MSVLSNLIGKKDIKEDNNKITYNIKIDVLAHIIAQNEEYSIEAKRNKKHKSKVEWSSSDSKIVECSGYMCLVKGINVGETTITLKYKNEIVDEIIIKVKAGDKINFY